MDDPEDVLAIVRCTYRTTFNAEETAYSDMGNWISLSENNVAPQELTDTQGLDSDIDSSSQKGDSYGNENNRNKEDNKGNTITITIDETLEKGKQSIESSDSTDQETKITVDNNDERLKGEKERTEVPYYLRFIGYLRSWLPSRHVGSKHSTNESNNGEVDVEVEHRKSVQQEDDNCGFQQNFSYSDTLKFEDERTNGPARDVDYRYSNELEKENKRLSTELESLRKQAQHDYVAGKARYDLLEKKLVDQRKEIDTFEERSQRLESELSLYHTHLVKVQQELQTTKQEKEDAQKRLSELMSALLRDNNPNIVDLSDQYRPTKLAEMMNELYDNQWTNLFSYIEDRWNGHGEFPERACIQMLLDIVMEAYEFCCVKTANANTCIIQLFGQEISDVDPELLKLIKDNRKRTALCSLVQVRKDCIPILIRLAQTDLMSEKAIDSDELIEYMHECIKLCWLMVLQDPPVYLVCEGWKSKSDLKNEDDHGDDNNDDYDDNEGDKAGEIEPALQILSFNEASGTGKEDNLCFLNNVVMELDGEEHGQLSELDKQGDSDNSMPITDNGFTLQNSNGMGYIRHEADDKAIESPEESYSPKDENEYGQSVLTSGVLQEPFNTENNDTTTQLSNNRVADQVTKFDTPDDNNISDRSLEVISRFDIVINSSNINSTEQENDITEPRGLSPIPDKLKVSFSKDLYKEYTRRGPYIDYIVWPVMYLHKDGPLLYKGVAQGCKQRGHFNSSSNGQQRDREQKHNRDIIREQRTSSYHSSRHGRNNNATDRGSSSQNIIRETTTTTTKENSLRNQLENEKAKLKREQHKSKSHENRIGELQTKNNSLYDVIRKLEVELKEANNRCETLYLSNKRLQDSLHKMEKDKDDAIRRNRMFDENPFDIIPMTIESFVMMAVCMLLCIAGWLGQRGHFNSSSNGQQRDREQKHNRDIIREQRTSSYHSSRHGRNNNATDRGSSSQNIIRETTTTTTKENSLRNQLENEKAKLKREQNKSKSHENRIGELQTKNNSLYDVIRKLEVELKEANNRCETLYLSNKRLQDSLQKMEKDKDDAIRRLSQHVGERLVQNNPNIADLSDPYRASRLAEMSNEIYDNEWTSAFTCLNDNGMSDNDCVTTLLNMLMRIHSFCQENVNGRIQALVTEDEESVTKVKEIMKKKAGTIQDSMYKKFYQGFSQDLKGALSDIKSSSELDSYTKSCFKLCWYMAIQDPPCVFQCYPGNGNEVTVPHETKLSRDHYREYTKRGPIIDYIVWPILMLDVNEPIRILSKGVAEGRA